MKKLKTVSLIFIIAVLILEILPYGAVLNFMGDPATDTTIKYTYSYFDLTPFGYANFGPFLTAILTCVLTVLILISNFTEKNLNKAIFAVAIIATVTSLMPLLYGLDYYNIVSFLITTIMIIVIILHYLASKT